MKEEGGGVPEMGAHEAAVVLCSTPELKEIMLSPACKPLPVLLPQAWVKPTPGRGRAFGVTQ